MSNTKETTNNLRKTVVLACIAAMVAAAYLCVHDGTSVLSFFEQTTQGSIVLSAFYIFTVLAVAELLWRIILVLRYRPVACGPDDTFPTCTVVVPAYNEGRQVFKTIKSLVESDYPKDKVQLIAVDDGSADDTWQWIQTAQRTFGKSVVTIRQPRNLGKRHALYAGFGRATGDILVTVDSDSIVEADTLKNLLAPFVADANVGAVAGNVRVLNQRGGIIPKMMDVVFVYSFDFMRASQSMVKAVTCTPGALSAYRKKAVTGVLKEWVNQTFWGRPANIGEDRAMTNMILKQGYDVVFQENARVFTEVPVGYSQLCKMYLRWARSNVRETIAMTGFIFTRFREGSKIGARINLISDWMGLTKAQILLGISWCLILLHPELFAAKAAFGIVLGSSLSAIIYAWKFGRFSSILAFAYGFFFFVSLTWIKPYAFLTLHKSGWLTRQIRTPRARVRPAVVSKVTDSVF